MTMGEAIRSVLGKYATFSGRAARPEFWWWVLALFLASAVVSLIDVFVIAPMLGYDSSALPPEAADMGPPQPLSALLGLAVILPNLAVAARRLHDTGRTAWWLLLGLVPVIGILVLIWFYIQPSDEGPNDYGPPPAA